MEWSVQNLWGFYLALPERASAALSVGSSINDLFDTKTHRTLCTPPLAYRFPYSSSLTSAHPQIDFT
jgi:hypothetical protein